MRISQKITRSTLVLTGSLLVAGGMAGSPLGAAAHAQSAGTQVYANCTSPSTRPGTIVLACADKGLRLERIRWSSWTATKAQGTATLTYNDCVPNCARGHVHDLTGRPITLDKPVTNRLHQQVFSQVHVTGAPAGWQIGGPDSLPTMP